MKNLIAVASCLTALCFLTTFLTAFRPGNERLLRGSMIKLLLAGACILAALSIVLNAPNAVLALLSSLPAMANNWIRSIPSSLSKIDWTTDSEYWMTCLTLVLVIRIAAEHHD